MIWLIRTILRPKWVVFQTEDGLEFGVKIFGIVISCYKGEPIYYTRDAYTNLRSPTKRELGESLMVPPQPKEWNYTQSLQRVLG